MEDEPIAEPPLPEGEPALTEELAPEVLEPLEPIPCGRQELDPRWIPAEQMASRIFVICFGLGTAITLIVLGVIGLLDRATLIAAVGLWLVAIPSIAVVGYRWPVWEYPFCGWRLTDQTLDVWKGLLRRNEIRVPRTRVQYTDVIQGPVQRRFGLGSLQVHVAGTEDATITVPGLPHALALRLRDELLEDTHDGDAV